MSDIDPQEFGYLRAEVKGLREAQEAQGRTIETMAAQLAGLVAKSERATGALWAAVTLSGGAGALISWLVERIWK